MVDDKIVEKKVVDGKKTSDVKVSLLSKLMFWKKEKKVSSKEEKKADKKVDSKEKKEEKKPFNWKFWEEESIEKIDYTQPIKDSSIIFSEKHKLLGEKKIMLHNSVNIEDRKTLIKEIEELEVEVKDLKDSLEKLVQKKTKSDFIAEEEKKEKDAKEGTPH